MFHQSAYENDSVRNRTSEVEENVSIQFIAFDWRMDRKMESSVCNPTAVQNKSC